MLFLLFQFVLAIVINVMKSMFSLAAISKMQILTPIRELIIMRNECFIFLFGKWLNSWEVTQVTVQLLMMIFFSHHPGSSTAYRLLRVRTSSRTFRRITPPAPNLPILLDIPQYSCCHIHINMWTSRTCSSQGVERGYFS